MTERGPMSERCKHVCYNLLGYSTLDFPSIKWTISRGCKFPDHGGIQAEAGHSFMPHSLNTFVMEVQTLWYLDCVHHNSKHMSAYYLAGTIKSNQYGLLFLMLTSILLAPSYL